MCIHMYAQVELSEYKLQEYELPEYNLTEDGVAEPEPEAEKIGEPASGVVPDVPAEDKIPDVTPAETEGAEGEVPAAATPDEYEGPADAGVHTEIPGPAEDMEASPGEVPAGVKVPITTKDHTGGEKVKAPVAATTTEVPTAAEDSTEAKIAVKTNILLHAELPEGHTGVGDCTTEVEVPAPPRRNQHHSLTR